MAAPASSPSSPTLRPMIISDLPSVTEVAVAAYPLDPQWMYRYPGHHENLDEAEAYIRGRLENEVRVNFARGVTSGVVCEVEAEDGRGEGGGGKKKEIVGWAIWREPGSILRKEDPERNYSPFIPPSPPKGSSAARTQAFYAHMLEGQRQHLDLVHGEQQLQLSLLYVHPARQGRGYGRLLAEQGLERARTAGVVCALTASPMGRRLYQRMGFVEVAEVVVPALEGDGEGLQPYPIMVWDPKAKERNGSS